MVEDIIDARALGSSSTCEKKKNIKNDDKQKKEKVKRGKGK